MVVANDPPATAFWTACRKVVPLDRDTAKLPLKASPAATES